MAEIPDGIVLRRHRDLIGRRWHPWARRALLGLVGLLALLALLDVFGQEPSTTRASGDAASLAIDAPSAVRGGILFQARFTIDTRADLKETTLVLDRGWVDGFTVNTIEPSPVGEASDDGRLSFDLGHLPRGARHVLYVDYQVNPTTVGTRTLTAELKDGEELLVSISRDMTVFP